MSNLSWKLFISKGIWLSIPGDCESRLLIRIHVVASVPKCHLAFDLNVAAASAVEGRTSGSRGFGALGSIAGEEELWWRQPAGSQSRNHQAHMFVC